MRLIRWLMALVVVLGAGAITYFYVDVHVQKTKAKAIDTSGQPTIGSVQAPIHMVVFEEPDCPACHLFSTKVLPPIRSDFVESGQVAITVIPVSFLPHSMPLAEAWISVYHQEAARPNTELFFTFVNYTYLHQPSENASLSIDQVVEMAKNASSQINLKQLADNLNRRVYKDQIESNTAYGKSLVAGRLATPALFINGRLIEDVSINNVMTEIHERLREIQSQRGQQ